MTHRTTPIQPSVPDARGAEGANRARGMAHDIRIEQRGSRPLAVVHRLATRQELPKVVTDACGTVYNVMQSQRVDGAGRHVAVYLDGAINLEVGVELEAPFPGHGEVVPSATPSGLVATAIHYGPYDRLHRTHEAVLQWCRDHAYTPAGPSWEVYGHWQEEWNNDPSGICTEVCYLVVGDARSDGASEDPRGRVGG